MGIKELATLLVAQQSMQAGAKAATAAAAATTNAVARATLPVLATWCGHMATLAGYGLVAAQVEFASTNASEKTFAAQASGLPPVT